MQPPSNRIVSVAIVTAGSGDYLDKCLDSVRDQTFPGSDVIVIDNSPGHRPSKEAGSKFTRIKYYASPGNFSYCDSLNKAIELSEGQYLLCLNDDVVLEERFIEEAMKGFAAGEMVGMVSGKVLRMDAQTIDSSGLFLSFSRAAKERGYGKRDRAQFNKEGFVFGVNGAVAFYRREMLEDTRISGWYFDPDFHFFYEDLDIAWRANRKGWKCYYVPSAIAYHARGASVRQGRGLEKPFARRYLSDSLHVDLVKNRYLSMIRNETLQGFLLHLPGIFLYDLFSWGYILIFKPRLVKKFLMGSGCIRQALKRRFSSGKPR